MDPSLRWNDGECKFILGSIGHQNSKTRLFFAFYRKQYGI